MEMLHGSINSSRTLPINRMRESFVIEYANDIRTTFKLSIEPFYVVGCPKVFP